jgi:hypothetical protein
MAPWAADAGRETMATRHFVNNWQASNSRAQPNARIRLGFGKFMKVKVAVAAILSIMIGKKCFFWETSVV